MGGVAVGITIIACGGNNNHITVPDSKVFKDAPGSSAGSCSVAASYSPTSFAQQNANNFTGSGVTNNFGSGAMDKDILIWSGVLQSSPEIDLRWFAFAGSAGDTDWPVGNVTAKSGLDQSTTTDTLVLLLSNVGSDMRFHDAYAAGAGLLNITGVGSQTTSTGSGLQFVHIDLATFQPINDGCMSAVTSFSGAAPTTQVTSRTEGQPGLPNPEAVNLLRSRVTY